MTTTEVRRITSFLVGQVTCFSSVLTSFRNLNGDVVIRQILTQAEKAGKGNLQRLDELTWKEIYHYTEMSK